MSSAAGFTYPRATILSSNKRRGSCMSLEAGKEGAGHFLSGKISRRDAAAALATVLTNVLAPSPSFAGPPVGEGGLPEGARQFESMIRIQRDWGKIAKRVKEGGVADEEWKNIQLFLRKLYTASDDMAGMSKGLNSATQAEAQALIKTFKEAVKAADAPTVAKDTDGFLAAYKTTNGQLDKFLAYFQDVPDEL